MANMRRKLFYKKKKSVDYLKYKNEALKFVCQRVNHYNQLYDFKFNRISIRNQRTRWGSCSKKGNLNFNYRLLILPQHLADYVIIHELCHLKEMNHSQGFWSLVARVFPNYLEIRKKLRKVRIL